MTEMSINDWIKSMKAEGFYGKFRATSGDLVINGEIKKLGEIESRKVTTVADSRQKIKDLFKDKARG